MKLKRGLSRIWAYLYRAKLARPPMPFWRVVVEARLDRRARDWPQPLSIRRGDAPSIVWARTIEEAEGLAALALEAEGLEALTGRRQEVRRRPPRPRREPAAVARGELGFLPRLDDEAGADGSSRRDARA